MATIQYSIGAGSTNSPYYFDIKITKQLCAKTSQPPVFVPVFSVVTFRNVGTNQYEAIVNVQGVVTFTPCGQCCAKAQGVNETFVIPIYSVAAPTTITAVGGTPTNIIIPTGGCGKCSLCGNTLVCNVPLTVTVA